MATREPRIGDLGTTVHMDDSRGRATPIVEEGETGLAPAWIAEFDAEELKLVERPAP